jgi:molybdopterin molybdotransferase
VIVVVGVPGWRAGQGAGPDGRVARIALAAAAAEADVELVSRVGDDPDGDALLLALSRAGVGHAAVLRDPSRATPRVLTADDAAEDDVASDPQRPPASTGSAPAGPQLDAADLELGLRYLTDYRVLVVADPLADDALRTVAEASAYSGARLVVATDEAPPADLLPGSATILVAGSGGEHAFALLVGTYAAALDRGDLPETAFRQAMATVGGAAAGDPDDDG